MLTATRLRVVACAIACWVTLPIAAAGAERPLTLDEALRLGVEKSEGIQIERHGLAAATAAARGARGAYDPVLELGGGWTKSTEPSNSAYSTPLAPEIESSEVGVAIRQLLPTGGAVSLHGRGVHETTDAGFALLSPADATRLGVELRQPLLRGLAIDEARLSTRVTRADRRGASASLDRALNETAASVEQTYWALAAARLEVSVRDEAVRLAEAQLEQTRARVESGTEPETEYAQPRAEIERRRGELLAARETVARTQNALKLLILGDSDRQAWREDIVPTDSIGVAVTTVDIEALLQGALATRPELGAVQSLLERRRAESAFTRSAALPGLDAVLSNDRIGLAGIALVLDLPILNRTARSAADVARNAERQAEAELSRVRKTIRAEVLDAAVTLETASQRIEAALAGLEAAQVQLAAENDRYAAGRSITFLVLTRQNDLSRARLDQISALADYRKARSEMARVTGSRIAGIRPDDSGD